MELSLFIELCLFSTTNLGSILRLLLPLSLSLRLVSLRLRLSPSPSLSQSRVCNGRRSFEEITENTDFLEIKINDMKEAKGQQEKVQRAVSPVLSCPILSYSALTHHDKHIS